MLTFHQDTAICNITTTSFVTKNGKNCLCSELFFIDGTSMKYYDFGKLARLYQCFVQKNRKLPLSMRLSENSEMEEKVNGTDE